MLKYIFTFLLLLGATSASAQLLQHRFAKVETDSARMARYKEIIGLDMTVPDFNTKSINPKVMGPRLANIIQFLLDNYHQSAYANRVSTIIKEQEPALEKIGISIKKIEFVSAQKEDNKIILKFSARLENNEAKIKRTNIVFSFIDGVSDNMITNELFSELSKYVQARELLQTELWKTLSLPTSDIQHQTSIIVNLERFHNQLALNLGYERIINDKGISISVEECYPPLITLLLQDTSEVIRFKVSEAVEDKTIKEDTTFLDEIKTIMKAAHQAYIAANTKF